MRLWIYFLMLMTLDEQALKLSQKQIVALLEIQQRFISLEQEYAEQAQRIADLERQNEWFKRQLFGRKSERRILGSGADAQLYLGEILDVEEAISPH